MFRQDYYGIALRFIMINNRYISSLPSTVGSLLPKRFFTLPKIFDRLDVLDEELAILHTLLRRRSACSRMVDSGIVASAWEPTIKSASESGYRTVDS